MHFRPVNISVHTSNIRTYATTQDTWHTCKFYSKDQRKL